MKTVHGRSLALLWATLLFLTACSKDKSPHPDPRPVRDENALKSSHLIKEIYWETFGYKATIGYRTDSSMHNIRYVAASGQTDMKIHKYEGKTLSEIDVASSLSKKICRLRHYRARRVARKGCGRAASLGPGAPGENHRAIMPEFIHRVTIAF